MDSESGWMVHCKVYGKRISGAALVCPNCGKAGPGLVRGFGESWMVPCRECGKAAFAFARYCWSCGTERPGERPISRGCLILAGVVVALLVLLWLVALIETGAL